VWQRLAWAVSAATALTLVALGAQTGKNAACAASAVQAARADSGEASARGGDCSLSGALLGDLVAAVSADEYAGSAACGAYLDVTGPGGTVRVQVVDECLSCEPGELDLSRAAFARIAGPERGVVHVSYHTVHNPEVPRPVAFRLKKGSSSRWLAIQAVDHGNPLRRLEILKDGRWRALSRDSDNYWVAHGIGDGPYTVRITDVYGQRLIATGIDLTPEQFQRTTRRLYAPATASPVPPFLPSAGKTAPGTAGGTAPRAATGNRDTQPRATGTGGPTTGTMTGASGGTEPGTRESKSTETGTTGSGGNGSGSTTSPGAEAGSASAGVSGPWGTGPGGPEGHAARGTLDIDPTGGPRPDPDRAPFTALPSARPFFC
jgi:expansin (peptidoglycan-binding protein)